MRGGPIQDAGFLNASEFSRADIRYSQGFGEWEAAHGAGLDLWLWDQDIYPPWFKSKVLAWWNLHILVELHKTDASIKKGKK